MGEVTIKRMSMALLATNIKAALKNTAAAMIKNIEPKIATIKTLVMFNSWGPCDRNPAVTSPPFAPTAYMVCSLRRSINCPLIPPSRSALGLLNCPAVMLE